MDNAEMAEDTDDLVASTSFSNELSMISYLIGCTNTWLQLYLAVQISSLFSPFV